MGFNDPDYRKSQLIRLEVISRLQSTEWLSHDLRWKRKII